MISYKLRWTNLNDCLDYHNEAIKRGCSFKLIDVKEAFKKKGFYEHKMFFSSEQHLNKFLKKHNAIILLGKWGA